MEHKGNLLQGLSAGGFYCICPGSLPQAGHVGQGPDQLVGVAHLVVVPGDHADLVDLRAAALGQGLGRVEDGAVGASDDVAGDDQDQPLLRQGGL